MVIKTKKEDKIIISFNGNNLCVDRGAAAILIEQGGYLGSNQSTFTRSTVSQVDIKKQELISENDLMLNIFPNPANNKVAISFKPQSTGKIELSLYDLNGKLISVIHNRLMEKGTLHNIEMETSRFPAGIYFVQMQSANNTFRKKFVISR